MISQYVLLISIFIIIVDVLIMKTWASADPLGAILESKSPSWRLYSLGFSLVGAVITTVVSAFIVLWNLI